MSCTGAFLAAQSPLPNRLPGLRLAAGLCLLAGLGARGALSPSANAAWPKAGLGLTGLGLPAGWRALRRLAEGRLRLA